MHTISFAGYIDNINNNDINIYVNPLTAVGARRALILDFTLSNTRRFYSSMGNPLAVKGLITERMFNLMLFSE